MAIYAKIAAISYLNTIPFVYGIQHEDNLRADLGFFVPSQCVKQFEEGAADIALLPSAVVPTLKSSEIITEYCIGANGKVRTVVLNSNTPIERVRRIWLDSHSRTSMQMLGYLAATYWHISPEWISFDDVTEIERMEDGDACLLIGDKVFAQEGRFTYSYDLGEEWKNCTHLPFAFAVWVARKGLSYELYDTLQHAFTFGIEHVYEAIQESEFSNCSYAYEYLTQNIDYLFDAEKHKALKKLWDFGLKVKPKVSPG